jgi:hypothetical protein
MNRDDRLFAIIGGLVVATVTTLFLVFAGGMTEPVVERPRVAVEPISTASAPTPVPGVVLASAEMRPAGTGDQVVRALVTGLAAHPQWAGWLVTDHLLGRFVSAVEAVADGYSPREPLDFLAPWRPFLVREADDRLVIAAGTYRRFDLVAAVVDSIDADAAVALVRQLEPEIDEARNDVAWHRGDFEDRLRAAIDHLLEVEVPAGPIEVEQRSVCYTFANDELEKMSDAQRQLVRMGSGNAIRIQHKLAEIRDAFGWPAPVSAPDASLRHAVITGEGEAPEPPPILIAEAEAAAPEPASVVERVPTELTVAEAIETLPATAEPETSAFDTSLVASEGLVP